MSEKHYPYIGGSFDRIVFDGDGSVWVPESENAKLRELCVDLYAEMITYSDAPDYNASVWAPKLRELGIEVD